MLIFICDIDNTIADTKTRMSEIETKYNTNGELWTKECVEEFTRPEYIKNDNVIKGAEILPSLARRCKAKIMFLTGRSERARKATRLWLEMKFDIYSSVPLIMRADGDMSDATTCKIKNFENIVLKLHPTAKFCFFDDDEKLLLEYSKYGLALSAPSCWQSIRFLNIKEE